MKTHKTLLERFFKQYSDGFNLGLQGRPNIDETVNSFSAVFLGSNPKGVLCKKNDESFRGVIPMAYEFYKSIGITKMEIVDLQITGLNQFHSMCTATWRAWYTLKNGKEKTLDFEIVYLVRFEAGQPKIFAYITPDEEAILKEKGLVTNGETAKSIQASASGN